MGLALTVLAPRVFPVLWTLVGPLIDETTRAKFMIHSGQDCVAELKEYVDEKFLPEFIGGKCFCLCPEGGHVPKTLYLQQHESSPERPEGESGGAEAHVLDTLYLTGYVYKGLPHEVLVPVGSKGCVLTWDFDVIKGGCDFCLLRTSQLIQPESLPQPSPPMGALSPGALVAVIGSQHEHGVAFDRTLTLGVDLFMEAKLLSCKEGDSVQGSHLLQSSWNLCASMETRGTSPQSW